MNERIKAENEAYRAHIRRILSTLGAFAKPNPAELKPGTISNQAEEEKRRIIRLKIGRTILELPEMQTFKAKIHTSAAPSANSFITAVHSSNNISDKHSSSKQPKSKNVKATNNNIRVQQEIKIKECATCLQTKDQHALALCDRCHLHYHLYCLDPPLRRMPKKTRFGGWQCSNCTEKDQEEEENDFEALELAESAASSPAITDASPSEGNNGNSRSATRKLRENPKSAFKFEEEINLQLAIFSSGGSTSNGGSANNSRGRPRGRSTATGTAIVNNNNNTSGNSNQSANSTIKKRIRKRKPKPSDSTKSTTPQQQQTQSDASKGRKRKLSSIQENSSSVQDISLLASVSTSGGPPGPTLSTSSAALTPSPSSSLITEHQTESSGKSVPSTSGPSGAISKTRPAAQPENCNGCMKEAPSKQSVR